MNISEPFIRRPIATALLAGGARAARHRDLSAAAGRAAAAGRFPDHLGVGAACRREPRHHGGDGRGAARAPVRPDRRRHADDLDLSTLGSTSITLQFDLNRNVDAAAQDVQAAITAAGRQLPQTLTSPPTYRKVNPADSPILILAAHSDTLPLTRSTTSPTMSWRSRSRRSPASRRSIIGGEQKPAIRVQVDPGQAADPRPDARGRARRARRRDHQRRQGLDQHRPAELHHPGERPG